jgi:uncharacterized protein DUF2695
VNRALTVEHFAWPIFCEALYGKLGGVPGDCMHDHRHVRSLLDGSGFDVEATVGYLRENGGACDCTVLLNVDAGLRAEVERST